MKQLLIEEMKRAIDLLESKDEIRVMKTEKVIGFQGKEYDCTFVDRETSELKQMFRMIRKHSVLLEKSIK